MKKLLFTILLVSAVILQVKAQQYVSTEPTNRNVLIEEFTGRECGYCTDGHRISNEIMASHPNRVWAANIHSAGYFSPTSYPNLNTDKGNTIRGYFGASSFPSGVVSRNTSSAIDRDQWAGATTSILSQQSYVNIGGVCTINPITRTALITVELYYTSASPTDINQLSVFMLQDSILGSQADYGNYNPTQWADQNHTIYIHMHTFRDVVNSTTSWGEDVSPTTQGTLITKTYSYQIPESIGSPNGVEVVIPNLEFIALVTEESGSNHKHIETACKLATSIVYDGKLAVVNSFNQINTISCSTDGLTEVSIKNGGTDLMTSMEISVEYNGQTTTHQWTGSLATNESTTIQLPVTLVAGTNNATVTVTKINGESVEPSAFNTATTALTCPEWISNVNTDSITINIWQDKFGNQITWKLYASDSTIIAQGGPYFQLGGNTTKLRTKTVAIPSDPDCIQFAIFDSNCDGINNGHGEGHYNLTSNGNIIFASDGTYTCEEKVNLSVNQGGAAIMGDVNNDGIVNILDVQTTMSYLLGQNPSPFNQTNADVNQDGIINILDIQVIISIIVNSK